MDIVGLAGSPAPVLGPMPGQAMTENGGASPLRGKKTDAGRSRAVRSPLAARNGIAGAAGEVGAAGAKSPLAARRGVGTRPAAHKNTSKRKRGAPGGENAPPGGGARDACAKRARSDPSGSYACTYPGCSFAFRGDIGVLFKHVGHAHPDGPGLYFMAEDAKAQRRRSHDSDSGAGGMGSALFRPLAALFGGSGSASSGRPRRSPSPIDRVRDQDSAALSPLSRIDAAKPRAYFARSRRRSRLGSRSPKYECEGNRFVTNDML